MKTNKLTKKVITDVWAEDERGKDIKMAFVTYFDGCYGIDAHPNVANTFMMGVCKLEFENDELTVYLRRPGLLIGKGGRTIDDLSNYLGCKVNIVEVNLCNSWGLICR